MTTQLSTREKSLPIYSVLGRKIRAHSAVCAESFREDRKSGLIYPAILVFDSSGPTTNGTITNHEQASVECNFCAYCGVY